MKTLTKHFFLGFVFAGNLLAAPESNSKLVVGLKIYGSSAESEAAHSRVAGTEVEAAFQDALLPNVQLNLAGGVQIETGATQSRWAQEFQPRNVQRLREAVLQWKPFSVLALTLGASDQDRLGSPLLLQRQTFPGAQESVTIPMGHWTLTAFAQQSVANDTSSLQPWASGTQGLPAFYLERVGVAYSPSPELKASVQASHFAFHNLSGPNVWNAQYMGNTIQGKDAASAVFQYGYHGIDVGTSIKARLGRFSPELKATWLQNLGAPSGRSQGWRVTAGMDYEANSSFRFSPQMELFRMESDAAPAFYNDRVFGHNNRNGFGARLTAFWPQEGVEIFARWVHAGVIEAHPFQSGLDWVQVQLSAQYDVL
ncbi:hypothetical protein K2X33_14010 [bacterium]|nr:hypothetical protein [bacterium]